MANEGKRRIESEISGRAEALKAMPEAEGHTVVQRGRKNIRFYVSGYEQALTQLQKEQDGDLKSE